MKFAVLLAFLLTVGRASAIILFGSGDPLYNTTAPLDAGRAKAWSYVGLWNGFTGTAISSNYFVTAKHVGGETGQVFNLNGKAYVTVKKVPDPTADMVLWQVDGVFPEWAPRYQNYEHANRAAFMVGRGTRRGQEVYSTCTNRPPPPLSFRIDGTPTASQPSVEAKPLVTKNLLGWAWGPGDGAVRWGTNVVLLGGDFGRIMVRFTGKGDDDCAVSSGDSSGALFLLDDDGIWKLGGVIVSVGNHIYPSPTGQIAGAYFNSACSPYSWGGTTSYALPIAPRSIWIWEITGEP